MAERLIAVVCVVMKSRCLSRYGLIRPTNGHESMCVFDPGVHQGARIANFSGLPIYKNRYHGTANFDVGQAV